MRHLRVLHPHPYVIAYYDGRVEGHRFMDGPNWVDDGAISLGIASYAVISGDEALVYDTHVSLDHARFIRGDLEARGIKRFTVLLSHWHLDHVAGTEAFADCQVISNAKTFAHLRSWKAGIEDASHNGLPAINPLVLPDKTFESEMNFRLGGLKLKFMEANIHSDDGTVVWIEDEGVLLAGDTVEDTITYVCEPENFDIHLKELDRLWAHNPQFILPNHGDPGIIAVGGYGNGMIKAQQQYIRALKRCRNEEALRETPLRELIAGPLQAGWVNYYAPYEAVHQANLKCVLDGS
jgi:cyclase